MKEQSLICYQQSRMLHVHIKEAGYHPSFNIKKASILHYFTRLTTQSKSVKFSTRRAWWEYYRMNSKKKKSPSIFFASNWQMLLPDNQSSLIHDYGSSCLTWSTLCKCFRISYVFRILRMGDRTGADLPLLKAWLFIV